MVWQMWRDWGPLSLGLWASWNVRLLMRAGLQVQRRSYISKSTPKVRLFYAGNLHTLPPLTFSILTTTFLKHTS